MNTVRNQVARQEILSRLCENAGVVLPVVEKKIDLPCLDPWAGEGVIEWSFLAASSIRKGRAFDLLALPAPGSRTTIGVSCVCLLFDVPFGNGRLAGWGGSAWPCAVLGRRDGFLGGIKFIYEMFQLPKLI